MLKEVLAFLEIWFQSPLCSPLVSPSETGPFLLRKQWGGGGATSQSGNCHGQAAQSQKLQHAWKFQSEPVPV